MQVLLLSVHVDQHRAVRVGGGGGGGGEGVCVRVPQRQLCVPTRRIYFDITGHCRTVGIVEMFQPCCGSCYELSGLDRLLL